MEPNKLSKRSNLLSSCGKDYVTILRPCYSVSSASRPLVTCPAILAHDYSRSMDVQTNQKLEGVPDRMDMHIPSHIILKQILRAILLRVYHAILDPCWNTSNHSNRTKAAKVLKLGPNPN